MKTAQYLTIFCFISLFQLAFASDDNNKLSIINPDTKKTYPSFLMACVVNPILIGIGAFAHAKAHETIMNRNGEDHHAFHSKKVGLVTTGIIFVHNFSKWLDLYTEKDLDNDLKTISEKQSERHETLINQNKANNEETELFVEKKFNKMSRDFKTYLAQKIVFVKKSSDMMTKIKDMAQKNSSDIEQIVLEVKQETKSSGENHKKITEINETVISTNNKIENAIRGNAEFNREANDSNKTMVVNNKEAEDFNKKAEIEEQETNEFIRAIEKTIKNSEKNSIKNKLFIGLLGRFNK